MKKMFNKAVLNGTTVMGDGLTYPRIPNVYTGDNEGGYQRGDMMDANAVVEMIKELTDTGEITIEELQNLINEEIQERVEGDQDQQRYTDQKIKDLIGTSPETLDTLKEIADALGEDPDFAANVWEKLAEVDQTLEDHKRASNLPKYVVGEGMDPGTSPISFELKNDGIHLNVYRTDLDTGDIVSVKTTNAIPKATTSRAGLMSASDKIKMNRIPDELMTSVSAVLDDPSNIKIRYYGKELYNGASWHIDSKIKPATSSLAGAMSASDKVKLNSLINYQAGNGIDITGNTISCTLDTSLYSIVTELPETGFPNKIYLLPSTKTEEGNIYTEYGYVDNKWEELGKYKADVDLEPYKKAISLPKYIVGQDVEGMVVGIDYRSDEVKLDFKSFDLINNIKMDSTSCINSASIHNAGVMSSTDKVKLDGIEAGAQVNKIESVSVNGTPIDPVDKHINLPEVSRTSAGILPASSNNLGLIVPYFFSYYDVISDGISEFPIRWGNIYFKVSDKLSLTDYCSINLIIGDNDAIYSRAPQIRLEGKPYEGISVDKENDQQIRIKTKISSDSRNILRILNDGLFVDKTLPNKQDTLTEVQLNNINNAITSISVNNIEQVNTNGAVDLTIPNASITENGLMSKEDKAKLDSQPTIKASDATGVTDDDYVVIKKSEYQSILDRLSALENKA